jgi:hypothetical protein
MTDSDYGFTVLDPSSGYPLSFVPELVMINDWIVPLFGKTTEISRVFDVLKFKTSGSYKIAQRPVRRILNQLNLQVLHNQEWLPRWVIKKLF